MTELTTMHMENPDAISLIQNITTSIAENAPNTEEENCNEFCDLVDESDMIQFIISQFVMRNCGKKFNCASIINQIRMHYTLFSNDKLVLNDFFICKGVMRVLSERSENCISKQLSSALFHIIYYFSKSSDCDLLLLEYLFRLLCAVILYNRQFLWTGEADDIKKAAYEGTAYEGTADEGTADEDTADGDTADGDTANEGTADDEKMLMLKDKQNFLKKVFNQVKRNIAEREQYSFFSESFKISDVLSMNNTMGTI
jgi:hypothetical protein